MNFLQRMLANTAIVLVIAVFTDCSSATSNSNARPVYDSDLHVLEATSLLQTSTSLFRPPDLFNILEMSECEAVRSDWESLPMGAKENQLTHFKGYQVRAVNKLQCTESDFIRVTLFRGPYSFNVFYNISGSVTYIQPIQSKS